MDVAAKNGGLTRYWRVPSCPVPTCVLVRGIGMHRPKDERDGAAGANGTDGFRGLFPFSAIKLRSALHKKKGRRFLSPSFCAKP